MALPLGVLLAGGAVAKSGLNWLGQYVGGEINDYFAKKRFDREFGATSAFQLQMLQKQHEYSLKFEKDKYSAQVAGMKEAGINPAITSAFSMGWTARN